MKIFIIGLFLFIDLTKQQLTCSFESQNNKYAQNNILNTKSIKTVNHQLRSMKETKGKWEIKFNCLNPIDNQKTELKFDCDNSFDKLELIFDQNSNKSSVNVPLQHLLFSINKFKGLDLKDIRIVQDSKKCQIKFSGKAGMVIVNEMFESIAIIGLRFMVMLSLFILFL